MSRLFTPLTLRELSIRNRIFVSPMCQYSSREGIPGDWHLVHLGSRAVGGAGLVMVEASAVSAQGRISPDDSGIWNSDQASAFLPIANFIREQGAVPAIQLAHAGRKASTDLPWKGSRPLDAKQRGWQTIAPSALPFDHERPVPREATTQDLETILGQFASAARRSAEAGFEVVEIHMAHGYLLHEFLSPLSNHRTDDFGGSLENRIRFPLRVAKVVRDFWPEHLPVFVRVSASDWIEGGWDLGQTMELARRLKAIGIDLIDCSSGGLLPESAPPFGPGFQTPFASAIRQEVGIATGAGGFITDPAQAEQIVATGLADAVFLARTMLRDPYWPLRAAKELGADLSWPLQYERAKK
ncbi:MAG: oxidoreductase [Geobacteraceae bacterium GWC2_58_44]|nr:MAG: oxidoreductase [Geobacteraceae bacterium GWC2_58_44]HBG08014.1 oxidoreductase [Geobacter sp.]